MPSPFPGMNPFFENADRWQSFHHNFITYLWQQISETIPSHYEVNTGERLYIHEPPAEQRRLFARSDVSISQKEQQSGQGTATVPAPQVTYLPASIDYEQIPYLTIRTANGRKLVTVIELLSPTNKKPGPDRDLFLTKRMEIFRSSSHYVEIDLLRDYPKLPFAVPFQSDYYVMVSRSEERPRAGIWPWNLREPMLPFPVPLRHGDPDLVIDLKRVLDILYDVGRFHRRLYAVPAEPPLSPADAEWAAAIIAAESHPAG